MNPCLRILALVALLSIFAAYTPRPFSVAYAQTPPATGTDRISGAIPPAFRKSACPSPVEQAQQQSRPFFDRFGTAISCGMEKAISNMSNKFGQIFTALLSVGLLSSALVQLVKDLFPTRRLFQRWYFRRWLAERTLISPAPILGTIAEAVEPVRFVNYTKGSEGHTAFTDIVERGLVSLAAAGHRKAFYGLPTEQFAGQLNAASQAVMSDPIPNQILIFILASEAGATGRPPERALYDINAILREVDSPSENARQSAADARLRTLQRIQRSLDGIQLSMASAWQTLMQWSAVAISFAIILVALAFGGGEVTGIDPLNSILIALLGGFVAPSIRDIQKALINLRG